MGDFSLGMEWKIFVLPKTEGEISSGILISNLHSQKQKQPPPTPPPPKKKKKKKKKHGSGVQFVFIHGVGLSV